MAFTTLPTGLVATLGTLRWIEDVRVDPPQRLRATAAGLLLLCVGRGRRRVLRPQKAHDRKHEENGRRGVHKVRKNREEVIVEWLLDHLDRRVEERRHALLVVNSVPEAGTELILDRVQVRVRQEAVVQRHVGLGAHRDAELTGGELNNKQKDTWKSGKQTSQERNKVLTFFGGK